jgi:hypothetical protein
METKKILLVCGMVLFFFILMKHVRITSNVNAPTTSSNKRVVYNKSVNVSHNVSPNVAHYNAYKSQYYN